FDERIVKSYPLLLPETGEVGIGFCTSFGTIDHKNIVQFESHVLRIGLNFCSQRSFWQGSLSIEQRHNKFCVKHIDKKSENSNYYPGIPPKIGAGPLIKPYNKC